MRTSLAVATVILLAVLPAVLFTLAKGDSASRDPDPAGIPPVASDSPVPEQAPVVTPPIDVTPSADEAGKRWPRDPGELEATLCVAYALEEGPVVCEVNLRNTTNAVVDYATSMFEKGARCSPEANWSARKEPLSKRHTIIGNPGPYRRSLNPREMASKTFYLHKNFLSIPAGQAPFRFGWRVYKIADTPRDKLGLGSLDLLFELKRTQVVEILPATEENVSATLRALEALFAGTAGRVADSEDYPWSSHDPSQEFVDTLDGCRHKEFVPLLFKAIDRLPSAQLRRRLVANVYESFATPDEGFDALVAYLSSSHPAGAVEVFDYWRSEEQEHEWSRHRQERLKAPPAQEPDPDKASEQRLWREMEQSEEDAWKTSKRHADTRLTSKQLEQLLTCRNVWVRALLHAYFPDRCPPAWVETLIKDLGQVVHRPERLQQLLDQLDDDSFAVRERATAEMIASGPELSCHVWTIPRKQLSFEVRRRLESVREALGKPELPRLWRRTISHLAWEPNPGKQRLLDALRKTDCPNLVSQAAEEAFQKQKEWMMEQSRARESPSNESTEMREQSASKP
jgi:hypothetical protein